MAKKEGKLKVYCVRVHKIYFGVMYVLVLFLCVFVLPFVLKFVVHKVFASCAWFTENILSEVGSTSEGAGGEDKNNTESNNPESDNSSEEIDNPNHENNNQQKSSGTSISGLDLLPDFLGGMAGISVGFILDFAIVDRLRTIKKYESMILPLKKEFEDWIDIYHDLKVKTAIENYETFFAQVQVVDKNVTLDNIKNILRQDTIFDNQDQVCEAIYSTITSQDIEWKAVPIMQKGNSDQDKTKEIADVIVKITDERPKSNGSEKTEWSKDDIVLLIKTINTLCCDCNLPEEITPSVLDDIVTDYENFSIVSNLPNRCPNFIRRIFRLPCHRPFLAEKLHELNCKVDEFNRWAKEDAQNERLIYFHLEEFETIKGIIDNENEDCLGIWQAMQMDLNNTVENK